MTRRVVEDAISISLKRMGVERLELLQFHWWDYKNDGYLDALKHLSDLQQEGKIRHLALTNFDTERSAPSPTTGFASSQTRCSTRLLTAAPRFGWPNSAPINR
jgi:aryl-alcohol dehydrogenase-like predicted oxidoreductase